MGQESFGFRVLGFRVSRNPYENNLGGPSVGLLIPTCLSERKHPKAAEGHVGYSLNF